MAIYGVDHPLKSIEILNKLQNTNIERYGVKTTLLHKETMKKIKDTLFERYGVTHPMHVPEFVDKYVKSSYSMKIYIFPSGRECIVQGYEPLALDLILDTGILHEDEIVTETILKPKLWYNDPFDNKLRRHYVDIYVPYYKWCIEIKSTWTYKIEPEKVHAKQLAAIQAGYSYDIWIMDAKGEILEIL